MYSFIVKVSLEKIISRVGRSRKATEHSKEYIFSRHYHYILVATQALSASSA